MLLTILRIAAARSRRLIGAVESGIGCIDSDLSLLIQSPDNVRGKSGRAAVVLETTGARKSRQEVEHEDKSEFKE